MPVLLPITFIKVLTHFIESSPNLISYIGISNLCFSHQQTKQMFSLMTLKIMSQSKRPQVGLNSGKLQLTGNFQLLANT